MEIKQLVHQIKKKRSFLCVGLDVDLEKVPSFIASGPDPLFDFSKAIVDTTAAYAVAFKPNIAFFETYGPEGMDALKRTMDYVHTKYPDIFTIADAKRGDIGNTSTRYAKAYFSTFGFDSITVAPYMGKDSVEPFLAFQDKHTILLALTSNAGASDFQFSESEGKPLHHHVISTSQTYEGADRLMYVVGATKASALSEIRKLIPNSFLLVPGVGAQGGSLAEVVQHGITPEIGLLVNSSRGILYASQGEDFAAAAAAQAQALQVEMEQLMRQHQLL